MTGVTIGALSSRGVVWSAIAAVGAGTLVGAASASGSELVVLAVLVGGVAVVSAIANPTAAAMLLVCVACLLPFGVIPVNLGIQPTLLDVALLAGLAGAVARHALDRTGTRTGARTGTLTRLVVAYICINLAALALGAVTVRPGARELREVFEMVLAIAFGAVAYRAASERRAAGLIVSSVVIVGGVAAAIGLAIHALPRYSIVDVLSSLTVVGYPSGPDVLRFLPAANNTYSDTLRATGTSIDPNVFGGMLMFAGAMALAQVVAQSPAVPRIVSITALGLIVMAMLASHSRGSWVGLAAAGALLVVLRYRMLALAAIPLGIALLATGPGQRIVERLVSGFTAADRAAALRVDEYRQAFAIIAAHPVLGVGFGGAPELGTFVGVSNIYLLIAEHSGLVGLGAFAVAVGLVMLGACRTIRGSTDSASASLLAAPTAAVFAALVAGMVDHYFANPRFPHMVALLWLGIGLCWGITNARRRGATHPN